MTVLHRLNKAQWFVVPDSRWSVVTHSDEGSWNIVVGFLKKLEVGPDFTVLTPSGVRSP